MRIRRCFEVLSVLAASSTISARFLHDLPQRTVSQVLEARQTITAPGEPASTLTPDPWQCITENVTQCFVDVPKPTGAVLEGINSFGDEVAKPCKAMATGLDGFYCSVSDPKSWCAFSTAVPPDVLVSYSTYLSAAVSFCTEKSSSISKLSTSCAVAWSRQHRAAHEWLKIAMAHAECYLEAHPSTPVTSTASTTTALPATTMPSPEFATKTNEAVWNSRQALEVFALMSTGLAILVTAA